MKCKVKDCENHTDQGVFVGFLCMPCYTFLNTGEGTYSQLYRNTVAAEREACAVMINILQKSGVSGQHLIDAIRERSVL